MRTGVAQGGLISTVLLSLYVDTPTPSHHVELALYADDTAVIASSSKPKLLVSYPETYLSHLKRWPSKWGIAINVSKSVSRAVLHPALTNNSIRGANQIDRHNSLSGGGGVTRDKRLA
jgi:hypothetical protein